ncbi:MAG TPA: hypothetical protein VME17_26590 [Bryobacteraceae bacterium]|nr:hypothetical protein [Bryobacteraceae bacterium]
MAAANAADSDSRWLLKLPATPTFTPPVTPFAICDSVSPKNAGYRQCCIGWLVYCTGLIGGCTGIDSKTFINARIFTRAAVDFFL